MVTHSSFLAWRIHGQRSLAGCSSWGCKESDMTGQISMHTGYIVTRKTSATPQLDQYLDKLLLIISL